LETASAQGIGVVIGMLTDDKMTRIRFSRYCQQLLERSKLQGKTGTEQKKKVGEGKKKS
jgi:hypothetical protein